MSFDSNLSIVCTSHLSQLTVALQMCRPYNDEPYTVICCITKKVMCKFPIVKRKIFSRHVLIETQKHAKSGIGKTVKLSPYLFNKAAKHYAS